MQTEMKLKAENNILKRTNLRLKAEKATDAKKHDALSAEIKDLHDQLADQVATMDKLRTEISERDTVISDNYASIQGLRRRCQELETHKFVLGYKVTVTVHHSCIHRLYACNQHLNSESLEQALRNECLVRLLALAVCTGVHMVKLLTSTWQLFRPLCMCALMTAASYMPGNCHV